MSYVDQDGGVWSDSDLAQYAAIDDGGQGGYLESLSNTSATGYGDTSATGPDSSTSLLPSLINGVFSTLKTVLPAFSQSAKYDQHGKQGVYQPGARVKLPTSVGGGSISSGTLLVGGLVAVVAIALITSK